MMLTSQLPAHCKSALARKVAAQSWSEVVCQAGSMHCHADFKSTVLLGHRSGSN